MSTLQPDSKKFKEMLESVQTTTRDRFGRATDGYDVIYADGGNAPAEKIGKEGIPVNVEAIIRKENKELHGISYFFEKKNGEAVLKRATHFHHGVADGGELIVGDDTLTFNRRGDGKIFHQTVFDKKNRSEDGKLFEMFSYDDAYLLRTFSSSFGIKTKRESLIGRETFNKVIQDPKFAPFAHKEAIEDISKTAVTVVAKHGFSLAEKAKESIDRITSYGDNFLSFMKKVSERIQMKD